MAMLISKFHKLIQSKLLWATFLVIVVFTFVIWGTQVPTQSDNAAASSPGSLNGEPVPPARFREAYFNTYLTVVMAVARPINITPAIDEQLRKAAWQRLAALDEAGRLGLSATDDEVAAAIQQHEGFSTEGQFNKAAYKAFVQNFLARMGFTERQFEEHVRQEIVMQKARILVDRMTLVTPLELRRAFSSVSDRFRVDYVALGRDLVEAGVKVTREEARAYFDKNPAEFTVPEKVKVKYVRFAAAPFIPKVKVTEEDAQLYYDEHLSEFEREDAESTNETEVTDAGDTNALLSAENKYKPFDEVKQEISNRLISQAALDQASELAMNFVVELTPDRDGVAPSFEEAAARTQLEVLKAGPFARGDEVEGVDAGPAFNRAAFELSDGTESYFSNPVQGEEAVYVVALEERIAERVPTFEEVEAEVMPVAREQALADALTRKAQEVRDAADKALKEGRTFADAVAALGLKMETTKEFSSSTGLQDDDLGEVLLRGVLTRNTGELTDLLPTEDGILLGHVAARIPGDATTYDSLKQQLVSTIRRQYGRINFDGWQDYLLQQARFEERTQAPVEDDLAPEEEESAPAADDAS
jgi:parvulin-like peptidyl-prolyl isomerase